MKFVFASVALCATLVAGAPQYQGQALRAKNLQQKFSAISPKVGALGLSDTNLFGVGNLMNFNAGYNRIDLQVLRSSGYAALADSIQAASEIALAAGEKGLLALEALEAGDLVKAKSLGDAASAEAVSSMALLPDSSSLPAETIDSLKAQGLHPLADSLANVRRMIDANVFTLKFLGGLAKFGKDEAGEATIAKAVAEQPKIAAPVATPLFRTPAQWSPWVYRSNPLQVWSNQYNLPYY